MKLETTWPLIINARPDKLGHGNNGSDRIILAFYKDNTKLRVRQKEGKGPSLEGCVYKTQFLGHTHFFMWDYGTAHAISEIIIQADVKIKNLVRTRDFFFGLGPEMAMTPNPQITLFRTHLIDSKNVRSLPNFSAA